MNDNYGLLAYILTVKNLQNNRSFYLHFLTVIDTAMRGVKKNGILIPYIKGIDTMLESGTKGTDIVLSLQKSGYTGSPSNVRHYIADWKKHRKHLYDSSIKSEVKTEILERKDIFKLLFHPLESVERIDSDSFERLCHELSMTVKKCR